MFQDTIIAKNQTAGDLPLEQLSAVDSRIPASGQSTLSDFNSYVDITQDSQMLGYINSGVVLLSVNGEDLTQSQSLVYLNSGIKNNLEGVTTAPGPTDDKDAGYSVGSSWVNSLTGRSYTCVDATVGAAIWANTGSGKTPVSLTSLLGYTKKGKMTADEAVYVRTYLLENAVISEISVFVTQQGSSSESVRMGLYSQPTPGDDDFTVASGKPSAKVAQTAVFAGDSVAGGSYANIALESNYVIPVSGYYWIAYWSDLGGKSGIKTAATSTFTKGMVPIYTEDGLSDLPASATPGDLVDTAIPYLSAKE